MRTRLIRAAMLAALMLAAVACTKTLDTSQLETDLQKQLQDQVGQSLTVTCPDNQPVKTGASFECTAKAESGPTFTVTVTQQDDAGNVKWKISGAEKSSATPSS